MHSVGTIAVVGSYGTGMTMRVPRVPGRGETISGATFSAGPGGKGSNQAIGAARLGATVHLLTAIGDDAFGASARSLWSDEGIDASRVVTATSPTMVGVILVEDDGENRIVVAPGALDEMTADHVADFADVIGECDLVMACNEVPSDVVTAALRIAHERGVRTLFNPAPARDLPATARDFVDYLTPNFTEGCMLAGLDSDAAQPTADAILDALRARYRATIALTAGHSGVYVDDAATGRRSHVLPVRPSAVVDTTGAGDAFNAAFAVALCRGAGPEEAARFGAAAGAFAVSHHEVIPGLARPADLTALLEQD